MNCLQQSTDNRPTFATNRPIGRKGSTNGVIKMMAEHSATLYEQFTEADQLEACTNRKLKVLAYGE